MGNKLTRREFLGAAAGTAAALGMPSLGARASASTRPSAGSGHRSDHCGELALVNGRIHTFDEKNSVVDSVRTRGNRVVGVGDGAGEVDAANVIDLKGRTVIPGLIDNHVHFIRIGNAVGHDTRELETAFSVEAAQEVIATKAAGVPVGEFITALAGIVRRQFAERRFPNLAELDEAAPRHPVLISESGSGQTNTLGRDELRRRGVSVNDDGFVQNQGAAYTALAAGLTDEHRKRQLLDVAEFALSIGLTTVMDQHGSTPGAGFLDRFTGHNFYLQLVREQALKVRTRVFFPGTGSGLTGAEAGDVDDLQEVLDHRWAEYGSDMSKTGGIGEWAPRGANYPESLRMMVERGWIYHQHLIFAHEIALHLAACQEADREFPVAGLHWSMGHIDQITAPMILQANSLGLGLAPHPWAYLTFDLPGPPFRTILDLAEVPVGSGLDGARVAPLNSWTGIYYMVTGRNSGGNLTNPGQQITREEAVRLWAGPQQGWFTKEEDVLGGIGVGRYADLVVLNADVFDKAAVPDDQIRHTKSVLTMVNGEIVHDAGFLGAPMPVSAAAASTH